MMTTEIHANEEKETAFDSYKVITEIMTEMDEESEVEEVEEETTMKKMKKSQDIFVDNPTKKLLDRKSKSKSNNKKTKTKTKSSSYVVRSTKRLFETLSFKLKPTQKKTSSVISITPSRKNVQVSSAPTFDLTDDNAGIDQDQEEDDYDDNDDDDALSHMSPHAILEMMKEQEEHRLQTEEAVVNIAVKDAFVVNEVMIDTPPLPPSLLVSSMSMSPLSPSDDVMMYVMANVMMYIMVYMVIGIIFNIYYNNNAKYLYEVLFSKENVDVLEAGEENPHDWQDIVATWL
ncbi:hypothetical protein FRACYDRAFT_243693 [Fragilariopsis cylindrus CCMP1102]|uniref:Transmembrane protein n=1 Tax=Fragilariopsis cylindrus CCMP1102 TaxID=635003 RepID=A0A1E7F2M7_9STRA|nr:hypothetical protein FRACYDRAFT_243693 [Fragilariopsis cylindrus CCMP1102]|eukprot:OEU12442.1 hypothetical protein FRACYDRAFT_243693 [Fragilariopsis cylindrus CCMP1102]